MKAEKITITVSKPAGKLLRSMLATGIYGRTLAEVTQRLVYNGLQEYIKMGDADGT